MLVQCSLKVAYNTLFITFLSWLSHHIIRPPDIVCRRTYILPVFLSSFFFILSSFFRRLISEIAERNWTKIGHMVGSKCNLQAHVRNLGYPLPYKSGAQNHLFWTTSQLDGNFNGLYLRNETWHRQSVKCVDNYKVSPTLSQNVMNFGPQTASNSTIYYFLLVFHCKFMPILHRFRDINTYLPKN